MRKYNITYDSSYKNNQLIPITAEGQGFHSEILDRLNLLINSMCSRRKRNYGIVITLNFPQEKQYHLSNNMFQRFLENYMDYFDNKNIEVKYLWVLEKTLCSMNHHYHIFLIMDGYKTKSFYNHGIEAQKRWARVLGNNAGGLVHYNQPGIFLNEDEQDYQLKYNELFKWSSYLAKIRDKANISNVRSWNSSQIKRV